MAAISILINRYSLWVIIAIGLSFVIACTETKGTERTNSIKKAQQLPDSLLAGLQEGDLALRRGRDVASYMISQAGVEDKTYSHCGLVHIENGRAYVYHCISGTNREGLVKDLAEQFFSPVENIVTGAKRYELTGEQKKILTELVAEMYTHRSGFDMDFDVSDPGRLYCSEFVYRVMNNVKKDSTFIRPVTRKGFDYIPIEALYMNDRASDIWQMRFK